MTELPAPPPLDPSKLTGTEFTRGRRGYEPTEVRKALGRAADSLRAWAERDAALTERIDELEARLASAEQLDEQRLTTVLGEETARIVAAARSAAAEIRAKATEDAERLVRESDERATATAAALTAEATAARDEAERARTDALEEAARVRADAAQDATRLREEAEATAAVLREDAQTEAQRVREEAEAESSRLREDAQSRHDELLERAASVLEERTAEAESVAAAMREAAEAELAAAREEADGLRADAREAADAEVERARAEGREMVAEARELRERMLRDLAERRRTARRQIEAARAGRDRIVDALRALGRDLDAEVGQLGELDADAQRAGDAAAAAVADDVDLVVAELQEGLRRGSPTEAGPAHGGGSDAAVAAVAAGSAVPVPEVAEPEAAPEAGATEPEVDSVQGAEEPVGDAAVPSGGDEIEDDASATVHDLFERIRAERADAARRAEELGLEPEDLEDDDAGEDGEGGAGVVGAAGGAEVIALDPNGRAVAETGTEVADAGTEVAEAEDPIAATLDRRDALLGPVERSLARTLKRLASDEQNEALDRLRRVKRGRVELDSLLPEGDVDAWAEALAPDLRTASEAGRELWAEQTGDPVGAVPTSEDLAESLRPRVEELLGNRRAHLQRVLDTADESGLEPAELVDHVRAAYREWRSGSLAELAGDLATAGFAQGTMAAAGPDARWCWLPDYGGLPCADAEDNALAGPVPCGEPFPTGDVVPPAHGGCRCILTAVRPD